MARAVVQKGGKDQSDLQFQDCKGSIKVQVRGILMSTPIAPPIIQAAGMVNLRVRIHVVVVDQTNLTCWRATQRLGGTVPSKGLA